MNYAKVENNKVVQVGLPRTGTLKDGSTVSAYHLLPEDILRDEGWLPLEENKPEYDEITQYIEFEGYELLQDRVIAKYVVKDKDIQIVDEHVDEEIIAMAEAIIDLDSRLSALEGGN